MKREDATPRPVDTRYLDQQKVRELGVILEVNRQLLHPRGLALEVHTPGTEVEQKLYLMPIGATTIDAWLKLIEWARPQAPEWKDTFDRLERVLLLAVEERPAILRIQDWRSDPEGVYYADVGDDDRAKAARFDELILGAREAALGYLVQPLE